MHRFIFHISVVGVLIFADSKKHLIITKCIIYYDLLSLANFWYSSILLIYQWDLLLSLGNTTFAYATCILIIIQYIPRLLFKFTLLTNCIIQLTQIQITYLYFGTWIIIIITFNSLNFRIFWILRFHFIFFNNILNLSLLGRQNSSIFK